MRLKPWAAIAFALIGTFTLVFMLHAAHSANLIPAPPQVAEPEVGSWAWNAQNGYVVVRDGDAAIAEGAYRKVVFDDDLTGWPPLDKALRLAWNHVGLLLLIFGFLAFIMIAGANSEVTITHRDGVQPRLENEDMNWPGGFHDASNLVARRR